MRVESFWLRYFPIYVQTPLVALKLLLLSLSLYICES